MIQLKKSPVAVTIQLLSKKWTVEIIFKLMNGRMRYSDLLEIDDSLTSKVLADRLKSLFNNGIVDKIVTNMMPLKLKYQLTEKGRMLQKVFFECALYSSLFFPNEVFYKQSVDFEELIAEITNMFHIEDINLDKLKKTYFDK